ncbi:MAG: AAA family ATPase [Ktedonobacteraceae bacterium]
MQLVAFKGMPGTGKSTLAHALAQALRWPLHRYAQTTA